MELQFYGAAQSVTGSKYLIKDHDHAVLVDCGLFQGPKKLRSRNWGHFLNRTTKPEAVLLTHAHLDHSGYLPRLVHEGFGGPIYATSGTHDLCEILLRDSAHIQEEDARRANKYGYTKHKPALPLYTEHDAQKALKLFKNVPYNKTVKIGPFSATWHYASHILGAAFIVCHTRKGRILFSGDMGRPFDPILKPPHAISEAEYLVLESTYGDRLHPQINPQDYLAEVVQSTIARGGTLLIPSFAVGRAQNLLYYLYQLMKSERIPPVPIYLDSPMAVDVTELLHKHLSSLSLDGALCKEVCKVAKYVQTPDQSKAIGQNPMPKIIIAGSGMIEGGRILHHLKHYGGDHRNTVLLTGYQPPDTRGAHLLSEHPEIKIHGKNYKIKAEIKELPNASAHADYEEMTQWLSGIQVTPKHVFITHGEIEAAEHFAEHIEKTFGWSCSVPDYKDKVRL